MLGADVGSFGVSLETEEFCRGSFAALADDINFGNKGSSSCGQKIILPNTPVNKWIVVGEPVVSKNHGARWIEQSHIKINIHTFTGQKFYRQSYGLSDNGIRCPIKQLQLDRVYRICGEFIILNKAGIHKAVSGAGVNKCGNMERRVGNKQRGQGNVERVGIGKSRRIELDNLGKGSERVNAVLRLCRGLGTAQSFFESEDSLASLPLAWTAQALALEADDKNFGQSFAEWPGLPQNMHKLLSKQCCLSCHIFKSLVSFTKAKTTLPLPFCKR